MMQGWQWFWVALGGALGACSRYGISAWIYDRHTSAFPWGTFAVNVGGSFLFGVLFVLIYSLDTLKEPLRLLLLVGFLGAFTTFSTFSFETIRLLESGQWGTALINVFSSTLVCLAGVWLGMGTTRMLL